MPKIKWIGMNVKDLTPYQKTGIPETAKKLSMPTTMQQMQLKAFPFAVPSLLVIAASMFVKTTLAKTVVIAPLYIFLGVAAGFMALLLHELLYAAVYPRGATVYVGFYPKAFAAVALGSYPLKRWRFILMSLLPLLLGVIPIAIFILSPAQYKAWNGFWFGAAAVGLISPYPDFYNVYQVLKHTPKKCSVQFAGDDMYWVE